MKKHTHSFKYQGLVYSYYTIPTPMPVRNSFVRYYEDRYYCTRCLMISDRNRRACGTSAFPVEFNAVPK